jgi:hypothetical protein
MGRAGLGLIQSDDSNRASGTGPDPLCSVQLVGPAHQTKRELVSAWVHYVRERKHREDVAASLRCATQISLPPSPARCSAVSASLLRPPPASPHTGDRAADRGLRQRGDGLRRLGRTRRVRRGGRRTPAPRAGRS